VAVLLRLAQHIGNLALKRIEALVERDYGRLRGRGLI